MAIESRRDLGAPTEDQGVYGISVAADIVGTGVQNLRLYERRGLVKPGRSAGGTRLYSADDIARLNRILNLLADGLNLAGIAMVLDLQDDNTRMRLEISVNSSGTSSAGTSQGTNARQRARAHPSH